jgi:hypothetical protein
VEDLAIKSCGEDAAVAGVTAVGGDAVHGAEEGGVVAVVYRGAWGGGEVLIVGVTGRADAGISVEAVDFKAGVVSEDYLARGVAGVEAGLEDGVAFEGGLVFCRGGDFVEAGQRKDGGAVCNGGVRGGGAEVEELARVGGGYVKEHGGGLLVASVPSLKDGCLRYVLLGGLHRSGMQIGNNRLILYVYRTEAKPPPRRSGITVVFENPASSTSISLNL